MNKSDKLQIRINKELKEKLKDYCNKQDISMSNLLEGFIKKIIA